MHLHLFGAATPSGEAFRQAVAADAGYGPLLLYSRSGRHFGMLHADFNDPSVFFLGGESGAPGLWISFGPIWMLAPFLEQLAHSHPERLLGLHGVIACSSSSAITKRFAANRFDRELVARLTTAEDQLLATCRMLEVPCRILRPTLIYGRVGPYVDRNLSLLLQLMRRLPFLPLPAHSGLRQPIHASQLAAVVLELARQFTSSGWDPSLPQRIALGGDSTLSYTEMLRALQQSLHLGDRARNCRLLPFTNQLFFLFTAPLLLCSPKAYEAVLRMSADLAGFIPSHQLLAEPPQAFPLPDRL